MNADFIKLKPLEGELKISLKKRGFGMTVSTKELVIHKPHINYYIRLADIVSLSPYHMEHMRPIRFVRRQQDNREVTFTEQGQQHYSVYAKAAVVHNRSGLFDLETVQFVIPIHRELLAAIGTYGNWNVKMD